MAKRQSALQWLEGRLWLAAVIRVWQLNGRHHRNLPFVIV